ncbi:MAG: Fe-S cluster protein [Deltaproteobacteria bacterium]|nr:MAG: Fe-S cluster protein [Deltaproteobacteria bacterium]
MLLKGYTKEIFRSKCDSRVQTLQCFAHLDDDISDVLPYLNTVLGGFTYIKEPPAVTFKAHGKLTTVYANKIAVNAIKDETEAAKILEWLKREINDARENRHAIKPSFKSVSGPTVFEIFKLLPKTNCRECGLQTCLVFATRVAEGAYGAEDCPLLAAENRERLREYLDRFDEAKSYRG